VMERHKVNDRVTVEILRGPATNMYP